MKKIFYTTLIAIFFIPMIYAQDINNVDLLKQLQGDGDSGGTGAVGDEKDGYKSFVQNEFSNLNKQIKDLSASEMAKINLAKLTEERVKLATDLCVKDSRACFLIEAYREYEDSMPKPSSEEDLKLFVEFTNKSNLFTKVKTEFLLLALNTKPNKPVAPL